VDQDVTRKKPRKVVSRFELAACRMAEEWLEAGAVTVSQDDLLVAREFLARTGWTVREVGGGLLQLARTRGGPVREMTREAIVLFALRGLAHRG
jgi:hypothetical protein